MTKIPAEYKITKRGPSLGQHLGRDIPAFFLTADGHRHQFVRTAVNDADGGTPLSQLAANESVIAPGLIYRDAMRKDRADTP